MYFPIQCNVQFYVNYVEKQNFQLTVLEMLITECIKYGLIPKM